MASGAVTTACPSTAPLPELMATKVTSVTGTGVFTEAETWKCPGRSAPGAGESTSTLLERRRHMPPEQNSLAAHSVGGAGALQPGSAGGGGEEQDKHGTTHSVPQ